VVVTAPSNSFTWRYKFYLLTAEFEVEVGVGVHQGSVLSPLLYIIVVKLLSKNVKKGFLELHLVLIADDKMKI